MARKYSSRIDAIWREIVDPIKSTGEVADAWEEFNVEAIAKEVLSDYAAGYVCKVEPDEFWQVVERHAVEVAA